MRLSSLQTGSLQRNSNREEILALQVRKAQKFWQNTSIFIIRLGNDWLVGEEEKDDLLKAPVGVDPNKPPRTGWKFKNKGKFEEDESLICSNQPEPQCCSITVSLSGETKKSKSSCEGKYKSTGLISMGREVNSGKNNPLSF